MHVVSMNLRTLLLVGLAFLLVNAYVQAQDDDDDEIDYGSTNQSDDDDDDDDESLAQDDDSDGDDQSDDDDDDIDIHDHNSMIDLLNKCQNLAKQGDCSFYKQCIEKLVPCGRKGWALDIGRPSCLGYKNFHDYFDNEYGKPFIDRAMPALMKAVFKKMKHILSLVDPQEVDCDDLDDEFDEIQMNTFLKHKFCKVIKMNLDVLSEVYSVGDMVEEIPYMGKVFRYCAKNYLKQYGKLLTKSPIKATKTLFKDIGSFFKRTKQMKL